MQGETASSNTARRDVTVIGGSAGSVSVLRQLLADLPADYPAAVFIVMHLPPESPGVLAQLLDRSSRMPVAFAGAGETIHPSTVTVAPPDRHLILMHDRVLLSRGPRENAQRPSIDVLFRSAAVAFGARVTGLVLSGMLDDGAAGLWAIRRRGGAAIVQASEGRRIPGVAAQRARTDRRRRRSARARSAGDAAAPRSGAPAAGCA